VQIYKNRITFWRGGLLVGLLAAALLTKPTTFFLLPTLVAALILYIGRNLKWHNLIISLLTGILLISSLLGAAVLYVNSDGGRRLFYTFSDSLRLPEYSSIVSPAAFQLYLSSLNFAVLSFWGLFGWSNIHPPWLWIRLLALVLLVMVLGSSLFVYQNLLFERGKKSSRLNSFQIDILIIFGLAIIFSLMGAMMPILVTQSPTWGIHSRYYFPAIIPIGLYLFLGTRQLLPARLGRYLWPGWPVAWAVYDAIIVVAVLIPFLYS
jgi:hypothetical protein